MSFPCRLYKEPRGTGSYVGLSDMVGALREKPAQVSGREGWIVR